MSDENVIDEKHKLMIEMLISNHETFSKCLKIMEPDYFSSPLDGVMEYIHSYYNKHHGIPKPRILKAETGVELDLYDFDSPADVTYALEELELFCQEQGMSKAILQAVDFRNAGKMTACAEVVREALLIKIDRSCGVDITRNAAERVNATDENTDERSVGIPEVDKLINKIRRREVGVVFGTTGAGKSVTLGNLGRNLAVQGLDVLVVTLELNENLYAKRFDCIITGADIAEHKASAQAIEEKYDQMREEEGLGSVVIKYLKTQSTCSNIRSVLMEYELEYKRRPDVILVDYIGLMGVDGVNATSMNKFDFDELKIFGLQSIADDYDAYVITAGQLNRDGADIIDVSHKHVAGGLSVVNGSDWAVAIVATEEQLDNNQFQMKQLKIRNGGRSTMPITLYKSPHTLRISSTPNAFQAVLPVKNPPRGTEQTIKAKVGNNQKAEFEKPEAKELDKLPTKSKMDALLKRKRSK